MARRTARLGDMKTGASTRPLPHAACAVLTAQQALTGGKVDGLVFPPSRGDGTMSGFAGFMARIVNLADLPPEITAHVLRQSFASVAADLELSEVTIASLIGHKGGGITRRYIHSADTVLLAAADKVAGEVAWQMGEAPPEGQVVQLTPRGA
nr:tyrosine-type recombinase/integrase [Roseococcus pinisoli]